VASRILVLAKPNSSAGDFENGASWHDLRQMIGPYHISTFMNDFVPLLKTALLLVASNTFMTFAWYGHLKYLHNKGLPLVILISWGIAFFEYCFQVPANRTGAAFLNGYQLKILQEVITLIVFVVFAKVVLGESIRWNHLVSFGCLAAAAWFAFAYNSPNQPL